MAALCSMPVLAAAETGRRGGIPKPYWGTWAPDASGCKEPAQRIVLSGKAYIGPKTKCKIVSVSETPSQNGPNYSARVECSPKGVTNLIIQPKGKDAVLSGHDMQSLKPYQRCSTNTAAATEPGQSPKPNRYCHRRRRGDLTRRLKRALQNGSRRAWPIGTGPRI